MLTIYAVVWCYMLADGQHCMLTGGGSGPSPTFSTLEACRVLEATVKPLVSIGTVECRSRKVETWNPVD